MPDTKQQTWTINELSREFDITPRSIRFYESEGLLAPAREGQKRIYARKDRVRLKLILRGKRLGFSLAETRELFELYDESNGNNDRQLSVMIRKVRERQAALQQQLVDLRIVQEELRNAEARCWNSMSADGQTRLRDELDNQGGPQ
ncbi:MerR family DNA-binding transcriptional regulator [Natronospirillum operosum]|uniref:MerR family DNA-binding transcriptional regulator n=2 Tax=Natronospirillum operosum TaxID=2759953 RepID=A0A4Z0WB24_9GAMM|nr:MerR family DNA-binding transcriptional regulator [Natronospirillum operosum]